LGHAQWEQGDDPFGEDRAYALAKEYNQAPTVTDASRDLLFNQRARP